MNTQLKELKNVVSDRCITIILNTHRTLPDNEKDGITLKNLVKEAENRLLETGNKKEVQILINRLNDLAGKIDHRLNLESLVLFVNEDRAEYVRLPVTVKDRVVIDRTFATRDLVRAMHLDTHYYILVLSRDQARLIEALNDQAVEELAAPFPVENTLSSGSTAEMADAGRQRSLTAEFFNRVDKEVNAARQNNPLPVLICTEEENFHEYLKIADQKDSILDTLFSRSRQTEKAHAIVSEAWEIIREYTIRKNNERKKELQQAVSANTFLSDTNEIRQAILEGRVKTLFVEQGLFQPAVMDGDRIVYVSDGERNDKEVIEDIYDELIEKNMDFGGDVVFLPKGELDAFNGFGAITRY